MCTIKVAERHLLSEEKKMSLMRIQENMSLKKKMFIFDSTASVV